MSNVDLNKNGLIDEDAKVLFAFKTLGHIPLVIKLIVAGVLFFGTVVILVVAFIGGMTRNTSEYYVNPTTKTNTVVEQPTTRFKKGNNGLLYDSTDAPKYCFLSDYTDPIFTDNCIHYSNQEIKGVAYVGLQTAIQMNCPVMLTVAQKIMKTSGNMLTENDARVISEACDIIHTIEKKKQIKQQQQIQAKIDFLEQQAKDIEHQRLARESFLQQ